MKHHNHYFSLAIPSKTALLDNPKAGTVAPSGRSDDCWIKEKRKVTHRLSCSLDFKGHSLRNPQEFLELLS